MTGKVSDEAEESEKYGEPLKYDPEFNGPIKNRSCTDILCLLLFIVFILAWGIVSIFAFIHGNPEKLIKPTDSQKRICGEGDLAKKPFLYFFDLTECIRPDINFISGCPTPQVCVEACPDENYVAAPPDSLKSFKTFEDNKKLVCKYEIDVDKPVEKLIEARDCARVTLRSTAVVGRCIPTIADLSGIKDELTKANMTEDEIKKGSQFIAKVLDLRNVAEMMFADFKIVWPFIIGALVLAMVLSLVWIILMRWIGWIMVWLSIFLVLALLAFGAWFCLNRYIQLKNEQETTTLPNALQTGVFAQKKTWLWFGIISVIVLVILLLILVFLRSRIVLAIALIEESSKAVGNIMSTLFFPLIPFLLQLILIGFWLAVAMYISSASVPKLVVFTPPGSNCNEVNCPGGEYKKHLEKCDPKTFNETCLCDAKCNYVPFDHESLLTWAQVFNLFALFWAMFFVVGLGEMVLAGAFATWYWTFDKKNVPTFAVSASFYRTLRYHLGSLAFGALLIAIVRMIRVFLEYIDRKLKEYTDNPAAKCIMCCLKCCFWCLEKFIKFINRNAYIMIAVYGKNFCTSAKNAFSLLMRNIVRVTVLDKVTDFLLFLGKLTIVLGVGVLSFFFFSGQIKLGNFDKHVPGLNYAWMPVVVICIGGYLIASCFFSVYSMAVDTLFLCFLEDCEKHDGSAEKPYHMSKKLMKILGKKNKFNDPDE